MADQVTPTVSTTPEKTPEDFEHAMAKTRESITEKVAALECQVVGTVQSAANTITDTVEAVRSIVTDAPAAVTDTVRQAAEAVSETMRNTFDITEHVRRHPWAAVGSAALAGCISAWLMTRRESRGAPAGYVRAAVAAPSQPPAPAPAPVRTSDEKPGMLDDLFGMLRGRAKELARTALESVSAAAQADHSRRARRSWWRKGRVASRARPSTLMRHVGSSSRAAACASECGT